MVNQLTLYNGALRILGQSKLATLTDDVEPRYVLDDIWDDGARDACLEAGYWNFAIRTVEAAYNTGVEPDFGFARAYDKPTDWLRTVSLAADERFYSILSDQSYKDEADYWFCDYDTLYIRYISNDVLYGYDYAKWPQSFVKYVESHLANEAKHRILQANVKRTEIEDVYTKAKRDALSKDAMNEGVKFRPENGWAGARRSGSSVHGRGRTR